MKKIIILFALLSASLCHAQETGIWFNWFGLLQDVSNVSDLKIENNSKIIMADGSSHDATESDPFTWIWNRRVLSGTTWETIPLDTAFEITASQFIDSLCHGVFVIELIAIHDDGRRWSCQGPCRILWTVAVDPCPTIPLVGSYTVNTWVSQDQSRRTFASNTWYPGLDALGKRGDLDEDGDVDTTDLLLFIAVYNSQ